MKKRLPYIAASTLILIAVVVFLPNFIRVRGRGAAAPCVNFLRVLDGAKQQWQLENNKSTNDIPTLDDLKPYIKLTPSGEIPRCPEGGTYIPGKVGQPSRCSLGGFYHSFPQEP